MRQKGMALDKRVRAVTEAAAELFSTRGFIETSMEEIARTAQMSKGGIYHYFKSKTEILDAVVSDFMDHVLADIEDQLAGLEDREEKLSFLVRRHVDIYIRHMHAARVLLKAANNLPSSERKQLTSKERRYYDAVAGVITPFLGEARDKGILTAATFSLLGMCNWIYSWYDPKGPIDPERLSEIIIAIFTRGICHVGTKKAPGLESPNFTA
ncbi:MAG: TetR/AcrR family transcriptional regulator [Candidatus Desulfacyla sp.]